MKAARRVLSVRDRIQYRAFVLFWWDYSRRFLEDGSKNPDYIGDLRLRLAAALYASRDDLFDKAIKENPELLEQYRKQSRRSAGTIQIWSVIRKAKLSMAGVSVRRLWDKWIR